MSFFSLARDPNFDITLRPSAQKASANHHSFIEMEEGERKRRKEGERRKKERGSRKEAGERRQEGGGGSRKEEKGRMKKEGKEEEG